MIVGLDAVVDSFDRAARTVDTRASRLILPRARQMAQEMASLAPVDSGRLRSSFSADGDPLDVEIGSDIPYSGFVEYGTVKMAPRPMVAPVADRHIPEFYKDMAQVVGDI